MDKSTTKATERQDQASRLCTGFNGCSVIVLAHQPTFKLLGASQRLLEALHITLWAATSQKQILTKLVFSAYRTANDVHYCLIKKNKTSFRI